MLLITPTLPLVIPPRDLKNKACQNVVANPKPRHDNTATSQRMSTDSDTSRRHGGQSTYWSRLARPL
jgi:hypothetical protein